MTAIESRLPARSFKPTWETTAWSDLMAAYSFFETVPYCGRPGRLFGSLKPTRSFPKRCCARDYPSPISGRAMALLHATRTPTRVCSVARVQHLQRFPLIPLLWWQRRFGRRSIGSSVCVVWHWVLGYAVLHRQHGSDKPAVPHDPSQGQPFSTGCCTSWRGGNVTPPGLQASVRAGATGCKHDLGHAEAATWPRKIPTLVAPMRLNDGCRAAAASSLAPRPS
jgi:hypothetical protein